jgi:hypothetical protein
MKLCLILFVISITIDLNLMQQNKNIQKTNKTKKTNTQTPSFSPECPQGNFEFNDPNWTFVVPPPPAPPRILSSDPLPSLCSLLQDEDVPMFVLHLNKFYAHNGSGNYIEVIPNQCEKRVFYTDVYVLVLAGNMSWISEAFTQQPAVICYKDLNNTLSIFDTFNNTYSSVFGDASAIFSECNSEGLLEVDGQAFWLSGVNQDKILGPPIMNLESMFCETSIDPNVWVHVLNHNNTHSVYVNHTEVETLMCKTKLIIFKAKIYKLMPSSLIELGLDASIKFCSTNFFLLVDNTTNIWIYNMNGNITSPIPQNGKHCNDAFIELNNQEKDVFYYQNDEFSYAGRLQIEPRYCFIQDGKDYLVGGDPLGVSGSKNAVLQIESCFDSSTNIIYFRLETAGTDIVSYFKTGADENLVPSIADDWLACKRIEGIDDASTAFSSVTNVSDVTQFVYNGKL